VILRGTALAFLVVLSGELGCVSYEYSVEELIQLTLKISVAGGILLVFIQYSFGFIF
jgi:hypothetical protein